jgi:HSP20 family protein
MKTAGIDDEAWDPLRELRREMGRILESFESWRLPRHFPALNLHDAGDRFVVSAELPGLKAGDVELTLTGDALTLRGERRRDPLVPDESYRRLERPFGAWSRTLTLPGRIDPDGVSASLALGVLTVVLPKAEEVRPRQIPVTMGTP